MNNLLLSLYGDDFTGSTDAMEALARVGLRAWDCCLRPLSASCVRTFFRRSLSSRTSMANPPERGIELDMRLSRNAFA